MTYESELSEPTALAPDEAFAVVGNETRVQILRTLGEAETPLSFTELRDRIGLRQGGQFNYHLDRLLAHFVRKTDEGYALRQAGRRVVEAVLSGAVTDAPVLERTLVEQTCPRCRAPVEVRYHQGHLEQFCTECAGTFGRDDATQSGYLGCLMLPPAGLQARSTDEAVRAAWTWMNLRLLAIASGLCPNCSAALERWPSVCEDHDAAAGLCDRCDRRNAVQFHYRCTNCILDGTGDAAVCLAADTDLLAFLTDHGLDPVAPARISRVWRVCCDYEEIVRSTDPFEVQFTFTIDDDTLTLTVGDDLSVIDATTHGATEPA